MRIDELGPAEAEALIEQLRGGTPPARNAGLYSVGHEKFLPSVRKRHLDPDPAAGKIRFVHGSWGSGKTHFFRLLTEEAFGAGWLVSTVELSAQQTPFNKFELVLHAIVRNISTQDGDRKAASPFGDVLRAALEHEASESGDDMVDVVTHMTERLFVESGIDIDVKKAVRAYWNTFSAQESDDVLLQERRGLLMQWFAGESNKVTARKEFDIQKVVAKENARVILSSLTALLQFLGYKGLLILFDESEMSHSTMSKSNLKQAHNNLLHLINEVGETPGLFLVYAAVPEFFSHPNTGIVIYGALAARIGDPPEHPPRSLDKVWNLDEAQLEDHAYEDAALRIRAIYERVYPGEEDELLSEQDLRERIGRAVAGHAQHHATSRWRLVVKETTKLLDLCLEGGELLDPEASVVETRSTLEQLGDD